jgi:acyl-CoA reductase-like NAD-dependent aldehyde dehydrogenase
MITKSSRRIRKKWCASSPARPTPDTIEIANDAEFGLADYFYSRDIGRI